MGNLEVLRFRAQEFPGGRRAGKRGRPLRAIRKSPATSRQLNKLGNALRASGPGLGLITAIRPPENLKRHEVNLTDRGYRLLISEITRDLRWRGKKKEA
jgi:hypothetical protein